MITIIDYGVGNIFAFQNVYKRLNIPSKIARLVSVTLASNFSIKLIAFL
jgi:imidazoleglycerol phosphate synthase glutamine amidotransferase subunit HisH